MRVEKREPRGEKRAENMSFLRHLTMWARSLRPAWFLVLLGLLGGGVQAQGLRVHLTHLQGLAHSAGGEWYRGGTELALTYGHAHQGWEYRAGLRARTVLWGSQAGLTLGVHRPLADRVGVGLTLEQGLALFRPRPLYVWGLGAGAEYQFWQGEKRAAGLTLGLRYTQAPAYDRYSQIRSLLEVPVGIWWAW